MILNYDIKIRKVGDFRANGVHQWTKKDRKIVRPWKKRGVERCFLNLWIIVVWINIIVITRAYISLVKKCDFENITYNFDQAKCCWLKSGINTFDTSKILHTVHEISELRMNVKGFKFIELLSIVFQKMWTFYGSTNLVCG